MRILLSIFLILALDGAAIAQNVTAPISGDNANLSDYYIDQAASDGVSISTEDGTATEYYTDSVKKGWWWGHYKSPEKKREVKEENKKLHGQTATTEKRPTVDELKTMDAKDLKEYFEKVQDRAVTTHAEDDVTWYYIVQDVIRRRSIAFMNTSEYVMQKHPELNTETDYPVSAPGRNAMTRQMNGEIESYIRSGQNDFALLYFYQDGCPYCEAQDGILKFFVNKYGWEIKPENLKTKQLLAARLGVDIAPTLILIKKGNNNSIPVSAGVSDLFTIESTIYKSMRLLNGETKPEEYDTYQFQKGTSLDVNANIEKHGDR